MTGLSSMTLMESLEWPTNTLSMVEWDNCSTTINVRITAPEKIITFHPELCPDGALIWVHGAS